MVTIEYECETDFDLGLDSPALAKMVAEKVLDMEKCPWDAQVNLVLTDNEEIKRVNTEFRGIERATDVLSFPMLPFETPADYSVIEGDDSYFDLDTEELILGDVMISVDKVLHRQKNTDIVPKESSAFFLHTACFIFLAMTI